MINNPKGYTKVTGGAIGIGTITHIDNVTCNNIRFEYADSMLCIMLPDKTQIIVECNQLRNIQVEYWDDRSKQ